MRKIFFIAVAVLLIVSGLGYGQEFAKVGTSGAQFLKIGVGARGSAMGEAYDAVCNDATSIFWNPAGLAYVEKNSLLLAHADWLADIKYEAGAYAKSIGNIGVFGISFASLNSGDIEETTVDMQEGTGNFFNAGNLMVGLSYARMLTDRFAIGGNVKYIEDRLADEKAWAWGIDIGTVYWTGFRSLRLAMTIRNFGPELQFSGTYQDYDNGEWVLDPQTKKPWQQEFLPYHMPMTFKVSVAYDLMENPNRFMTVALDLVHPNDNVEKLNLGAELRLLKILSLRAGYTGLIGIMKREDEETENVDAPQEISYTIHNYTQNFAAGVGFDLSVPGFAKFNLDYAYSDFGVLDWVHRASLVVSF